MNIAQTGAKQKTSLSGFEILYDFGSNSYRYAFSAQDSNAAFYAFPTCAGNVMKYDYRNNNVSFLSGVAGHDYEYSAGVFDAAKNRVWGFPRNADSLLEIDAAPHNYAALEIPLGTGSRSSGIHGAMRYSGALAGNFLFCPPRNSQDGILCFSTVTRKAENIPLPNPGAGVRTHYSGSVLHPNGSIYFLPSTGSRVAVLDPATRKTRYIGDAVHHMMFGGAVWRDGNIYSLTDAGAVKIDTVNETVSIVSDAADPSKTPTHPCVLGTVAHPNGKLYGVDATGGFLEYNPELSSLERYSIAAYVPCCSLCQNPFTTGEVMPDGNLYLVPCTSRYFLRCVFA